MRDGVVRLAAGDVDVELLPDVGGRVHRIRVGGFDLLRTPASPERARQAPFFWSSFVMAPWCNRVPGASLATRDGPVQLTSNWEDGSALHGEVYAQPWTYLGEGRCEIRCGGGEFPWPYTVRSRTAVDPSGVAYELSLTNDGRAPMPAGLGWHPWFRADGGSLRVTATPRHRYELDLAYVPVGDAGVLRSGVGHDPNAGGVIPWETHDLYTALVDRVVELRWPRGGVWAALSFSVEADHLLLFAHRDVDAVAVEAQTHAIDGHRRALTGRPGGTRLLPPGSTMSVQYQLSVRRVPKEAS